MGWVMEETDSVMEFDSECYLSVCNRRHFLLFCTFLFLLRSDCV